MLKKPISTKETPQQSENDKQSQTADNNVYDGYVELEFEEDLEHRQKGCMTCCFYRQNKTCLFGRPVQEHYLEGKDEYMECGTFSCVSCTTVKGEKRNIEGSILQYLFKGGE